MWGLQVAQVSVGPNIRTMRQHPTDGHLVVTGGDENPVKLLDLNNLTEPIFKAKNVRLVVLENIDVKPFKLKERFEHTYIYIFT